MVRVYAEKGIVSNCVNIALQSPATHMITVRHFDRVGENRIFEGGDAAVAKIRFHGVVDAAVVDKIRSHPDVLAVSLVDL